MNIIIKKFEPNFLLISNRTYQLKIENVKFTGKKPQIILTNKGTISEKITVNTMIYCDNSFHTSFFIHQNSLFDINSENYNLAVKYDNNISFSHSFSIKNLGRRRSKK